MIKVLRSGTYELLETKAQTKILILDTKKTFAWVNIRTIGEILVTSHKVHKTDTTLAVGTYRLYNVENEPKLSDQIHLELALGQGLWQGYLLPTGLPTKTDKRNRIIPTHEVITKSQPNSASSF